MLKTYSEKLLDPRWQRKRLEVLSRTDFHCEACGDGENTIHVHHRLYIKGREPWEYDYQDLAALCKDCHSREHGAKEMLKLALSLVSPCYLDWEGVVSLVAGFISLQTPDCQMNPSDLETLHVIGKKWGDREAFEAGRAAHEKLQGR